MVICLERGADLHMAQLMPLPLTVCCFSKIQIGFTFLVPAHLGSPGKGPLNRCGYSFVQVLPSVLRHCRLCVSKSIRPVKIWVMMCWCGYQSRARRCRLFAYGPADATASQNPIIYLSNHTRMQPVATVELEVFLLKPV